MKYYELLIKIKSEDGEKASAIAAMLDIGGLYLEDYSDMMDCDLVKQIGLIDEELLAKDTSVATLHVYLPDNTSLDEATAYLEERFSSENVEFEISHDLIDEEEYANSWKKYYKPLKIGEKIVVCPVWENYDLKEGETVLKIDPGMAFGTGTHETTSLCIEYLQKEVKDGDKILDVGCGSGILSITSLLCGASEALALDIDPNAVRVSYENAELNNFNGKFEAVCDNLLDPESEIRKRLSGKKYNIIVANIVADIIIRLSDFIYEYLEDDGLFIVSGIITERENDVLNALDKNNFKVLDRSEKKGWVCIKTNR